jgi:ssDNA-binding Zn-finger/Zn-ribbon topoisomerase 1
MTPYDKLQKIREERHQQGEEFLPRIEKAHSELAPCPFCGGKVGLVVTDDEGNYRGCPDYDREEMLDYLDCPYSGVSVCIHHGYKEHNECPLHNWPPDQEGWVTQLYDNPEDAVKAWNRRV